MVGSSRMPGEKNNSIWWDTKVPGGVPPGGIYPDEGKHLGGQHDQQSHAGDRGYSETSILFDKSDEQLKGIYENNKVLEKDIFSRQLDEKDFYPGGKYEQVAREYFGGVSAEQLEKILAESPGMIKDTLAVPGNLQSRVNKFDSQNILFDKLKDNDAFMKFANYNIDSGIKSKYQAVKFQEAIKDMTDKQVQDYIVKREIRNSVDLWASTSGDTDIKATAMQMAAKELFSVGEIGHLSKNFERGDISPTARERLKEELVYNPGRKAFLQAQYDATQDYLKKNNINEIVVYRGQEGKKSKLPEGRSVDVDMQPLSSFSLSMQDAVSFANPTDDYRFKDKSPSVIASVISASRVFAMPNGGIGCTGEHEVVVLGGRMKASIVTGISHLNSTFDDEMKSPGDFKRAVERVVIKSFVSNGEVVTKSPRKLNPIDKDQYEFKFREVISKYERDFQKIIQKFFKDQADEVLGSIRKGIDDVEVKHLQGQHDQQSHGGEGGHVEYIKDKEKRIKHLVNISGGKIGPGKAKSIINAISGYIDGDYYNIRTEKNDFYRKKKQLLEEFVSKVPSFKETIYRGFQIESELAAFSKMKVGGTVKMGRGISSWSSDQKVANHFAMGFGRSYIFEAVGGTNQGASVSFNRIGNSEKEVLVSGNARFKILSIEQKKLSAIGMNVIPAHTFVRVKEIQSKKKDFDWISKQFDEETAEMKDVSILDRWKLDDDLIFEDGKKSLSSIIKIKSISQEMRDHFEERTKLHILLVQKYLQKIIDLNDNRLGNDILEDEKDHDQSKYEDPEFESYLHVNWHYHMESQGEKYDPSQEIKDQMDEATFHHVKNNKHHPEYWDENSTEDVINRADRDKPPSSPVNAKKMPMVYVASMVADWLAMSEEKKTDPYGWAKKNIGTRWEFTADQIELIYDLLKGVWKSEKRYGLAIFKHLSGQYDQDTHGRGKYDDDKKTKEAFIGALHGLKKQKSLSETITTKASPNSLPDRFDFSGWSFDKKTWNERLQKEGGLFIKEMYDKEGIRAYAGLRYWIEDLAGAFNIDDPLVQEFLDDYVFTFANNINMTTEELLRQAMKSGMTEGLGMSGIAEKIEGLYDTWDKWRSLLIARTETIRASNNAAVMAYRQSGVVEGKEWLVTRDDRLCFPANTSVKTIDGYKRIQDVQVGDFVLTHKDRYRKVVKTHLNLHTGEFIRIYYKSNRGNRRLVCTPNHPILINGEWKKAEDIIVGDKVFHEANPCEECGKLTNIGRRYCSSHCQAIGMNKTLWEDPLQHERVSRQNKEFGKGKLIKSVHEERRQSDPVYKEDWSNSVSQGHKKHYELPENREKRAEINRKTAQDPDWGWRNKERLDKALFLAYKIRGKKHLGQTFLEKKVKWWFEQNNYNFEEQKYFNNGERRFWVDFYLPDYNIIIEADGEYFHNEQDDRKRDESLRKCFTGQILHFTQSNIMHNFGRCVFKLNKAIRTQNCFVESSVMKVERVPLDAKVKQPVYNLTVEEDNSYVASRIVVHNCEFCRPMQGKVIGLDKNFFDKGDSVEFGDGDNRVTMKLDYEDVGSPPLHPNCRCTIIPYFKGIDEKQYGLATIFKGGPSSGNYGHEGRPGKVGGSGGGTVNISLMRRETEKRYDRLKKEGVSYNPYKTLMFSGMEYEELRRLNEHFDVIEAIPKSVRKNIKGIELYDKGYSLGTFTSGGQIFKKGGDFNKETGIIKTKLFSNTAVLEHEIGHAVVDTLQKAAIKGVEEKYKEVNGDYDKMFMPSGELHNPSTPSQRTYVIFEKIASLPNTVGYISSYAESWKTETIVDQGKEIEFTMPDKSRPRLSFGNIHRSANENFAEFWGQSRRFVDSKPEVEKAIKPLLKEVRSILKEI